MTRRKHEETKEVEVKLYDEKKVAAALGVRRRFVCRWRESMGERGKHFAIMDGQVAITDQGLIAVTEAMGLKFSIEVFKEAEIKKTGVITVAVYFQPPNRNVLLVKRADNKVFPEHVEVHDSSLFRIGDTFEAIEKSDGNGLVFYGRWPETGW